MPVKNYQSQNCPIALSLSIVGDQWTMLIIRDVLMGLSRFDEIQKSLGASRNLLTTRLNMLVEEGILRKEKISPDSPRMQYLPTPKCAHLTVVLKGLNDWRRYWYAAEDKEVPNFDLVQKSSGSPVKLGFINTDTNEGVELNDVANAIQKYNLSYT